MDINNNQQINTFTGGMNTDTSDALLKPQEYRKAVNLRPITNTDSNDGELHLIDGVSESVIYDSFSEIYATTSVRDLGVIIGERDGDEGWSINILQNNNLRCVFGPCSKELGDNLSLVTRWESDTNVKLYIADGEHRLMSINLMHDDYTGTQANPIAPSSFEYIADTDNNVPQMTAAISGTGNIKGVVVQYTYLLYKQYGSQTNVAPLTAPISLYNGDKGFKQNEYTNKSVELSLSYQADTFDKIKVFRIAYIQNGQEPEVNVIVDDTYTGSFNYIDQGTNISELSYGEFIATSGINVKPLLIESKENTLFCANVEYDQQEIDDLFKNVTVTITPYNEGRYLTPEEVEQKVSEYMEETDGQGVMTEAQARYFFQHQTYPDYTFTAYGEYSGDYGRTLMPGEKYRYGIVFYDKEGRKSSVMHIQEVTAPNYQFEEISTDTNGTDELGNNKITNATYSVKKIGIRATVTFPQGVKNKCAGYEIVRCERTVKDSRTITQGIVGCTASEEHYVSSTETYISDGYTYNNRFAMPYMSLWDSYWERFTSSTQAIFRSAGDILTFASPESVYKQSSFKDSIDTLSNKSIEINHHYFIPFEAITETNTGGSTGRYVYVGGDGNNNVRFSTQNGSAFRLVRTSKRGFVKDENWNFAASYIFPYSHAIAQNSADITTFGTNNTRNIKNYKFIDSPEYNQFDNNGSIRINDDTVPIDTFQYINWSTSNLYMEGEFNDGGYVTESQSNLVSTGKKGMILQLQDQLSPRSISTLRNNDYLTEEYINIVPITVASIINTSVVPYGGDTTTARNNSIFYSFGDYVNLLDPNVSDTNIFYDGDCYFGLFIYNSSHIYYSSQYKSTTYGIVYAVPLYSTIDLKAVCGDLYPKIQSNKKYYFQDVPVSIDGYIQEHSAYIYNDAYSQTPVADKHTAIDWSTNQSEKFDTRIIYSNEKTNNELIDSWLTFKSANYLDVDTRYGEITNLRLFKNTLVFWQEYATGILSVNERTMIQDANDTNIILGNGDVLQRYDYITTLYGSAKEKPCDAQSNTTLYWWDYNKGEILGYSGGQSVQPLNKVKNISNFIRVNNKINKPAAVYDQDNNEILFNVVKDGTDDRCLVYNEIVQGFTSLYDMPFDMSLIIPGSIYYIYNNNIYVGEKNAEEALSTTGEPMLPYLKYIVNTNPQYNKVFDIQIFGGSFYDNDPSYLRFVYNTNLDQTGICFGDSITNREYDYRMNIPRAGMYSNSNWRVSEYGDRLRGKTMQCELRSSSNSTDFSLQYITTKYRMSWS